MGANPRSADRLDGRDAELPRLPQQRDDGDGAALAARRVPQFSGTQIDDLSGTWSGVERGLTRLGAAYLGNWGWIEADLIVGFPLKTPTLDIDWHSHDRRALGGHLPYHRETQAGRRLFDRLQPGEHAIRFGDTKINFYGLTLGVDFANREKPPERGEDGFYLAFAVAFKYSYGSGRSQACCFPATCRPQPRPTQPRRHHDQRLRHQPSRQSRLLGARVGAAGRG